MTRSIFYGANVVVQMFLAGGFYSWHNYLWMGMSIAFALTNILFLVFNIKCGEKSK